MMNRPMLIISALVVTSLFATTTPSYAISYWDYWTNAATERANTLLGAYSWSDETRNINNYYWAYKNEQKVASVGAIGQPAIYEIAGIAQTPGYPTVLALQGQTISIDFGFVDPATGLYTAGPPVGSVEYLVNVDPTSPTDLVPISTSYDASSGFSTSYVVSSSAEPAIEAVPYDANGNPIVIPGVDGDNVAQGFVTALYVPEPSAIVLLGIGGIGLLARRRRAA